MERVFIQIQPIWYSIGISLYSRNKQEFELKQKKSFKVEWLNLKLKEKGICCNTGHSDLTVSSLTTIRLHDEKAEIQKQKEYFAKLRTEFQPDGGKVRHSVWIELLLSLISSRRMITVNMKGYQVGEHLKGQQYYNQRVA